jgi:hypothetical protein
MPSWKMMSTFGSLTAFPSETAGPSTIELSSIFPSAPALTKR